MTILFQNLVAHCFYCKDAMDVEDDIPCMIGDREIYVCSDECAKDMTEVLCNGNNY